ncbi:MAG: hypothetical protein U0797_20735 [Gemmataceae bacterium]
MDESTATPPSPDPVLAIDTAVAAAVSAPVLVTPEPAPPPGPAPAAKPEPPPILIIDIGGTKVKILATGQTEPRKAPSGKEFTPAKLVETVRELAQGWDYQAISIGYPGLVGAHGPRSEPGNLGPGWVGFDYPAAFGLPVKMVNDAAMQALGSYDGGRMLFLGLGTGLGSALIAGQVIVPLELGRLPFDGTLTLGEVLGRRGLERIGKREWRKAVDRVVPALMGAFAADSVVLGGGNSKLVKNLPPGTRLGHNLTAFRGGVRLWGLEDVWVLGAYGDESPRPGTLEALRMV